MTIKKKLDQHYKEISTALHPASEASRIANTKRIDLIIKWLKENEILFNYQNL